MPLFVALALGISSFAIGLFGAEPWEAAFAPDTAAILSAAQAVAVEDDPPVVVLLEEHAYTIDKQGRIASKDRHVYLVRHRDAVDEWSAVRQEYQPWHENRPEIRARVIAPEGGVRTLDPSTIADAPANQYDADIYSDRRLVRAPLPGVEPGSVVEAEIVSSESRTQLGAGSARRVAINQFVPVQRFRLSIDAHRQIPLQTAVHEIPAEAVQRSAPGKRTSIRVELGPLRPSSDDFEFNVPADQSQQKHITFSTGRSWQQLAAAYGQVVDEKIAGAKLSGFLEGLDLKGPPLEVAGRITAKLHSVIRYTGVEFAEAEIIPGAPSQTLTRGYGDCKDKSTLLTALLRAAGLDAHVALLAAGSDRDVEPQLPGLGLFNHVIVYVDTQPPLWIDATAEHARVGVLPSAGEGRLALIARPETAALVATPLSRSLDNWRRRTTTIRMGDFGPGSMREITEAGGALETDLRAEFSSNSSSVREAIEENVEKSLQGTLASFETSDRSDFTSAFQVSLEVEGAGGIATAMEEAAVGLDRSGLFELLPFSLTIGLGGIAQDSDDQRKSDVWFHRPHRTELRYLIHPPALFKAVSLPESANLEFGPARYSLSVETLDDGSIEIVYEFDSGKRRWSPDEVSAFRKAAKPYYSTERLVVRFIPRSAELTALGEIRTALAELTEYAEKHPDNAPARARLSRLLVTAGLGEAALQQASRATDDAPDSVAAWIALGWAHQHDAFGRRFRGDRERAVAALRKAVELESDKQLARAELTILLEHDERGVRYSPRADLAESIEIYEELLEEQAHLPYQPNLITALIRSDRLDEAKESVERGGQGFRNAFGPLIKVLDEGPGALVLDLQAKFPDSRMRAQLLWNVGFALLQLRRYELALPIFKASSRIRTDPVHQRLLQLLARITRFEDATPAQDDPRSPVWKTLVALLTEEENPDDLKELFTTRDDWSAWEVEIAALRTHYRRAKAQVREHRFEEDPVIDVILSTTNLRSEGDDQHGFHVSGDAQPSFLVVCESGEYRIVGTRFNLAEVGKLVWRLVEEDDIETARSWLDKAVKVLREDTSSRLPPATLLWAGETDELRGAEAAKVAAAALVSPTETSDRAIRILRESAESASVTIERNQANTALAEALKTAEQWDALAETARSLGESETFASESFEFASRAARGSDDWPELARLAEERLGKRGDDPDGLHALAEAGAHQADPAVVERATSKLLEADYVALDDLMFDVWMRRIVGQLNADHLSALQKKAERYGEAEAEFYYTQAMMQAELDQPDEAMQSLRLAVGDSHADTIGPKAWFIKARICERYGFPEAAEAARQRARQAVSVDDIDRWALAAFGSSDP